SAAAGLAVLDVIERENLQQNARDTGGYLVDELRALGTRHELIGDVRGNGLYIGLELVLDHERKSPAAAPAKKLINALRDRGLLTSTTGPNANILKIRGPMVLTREDAGIAVGIIESALVALESQL
ncbi:MAG: aminotransferase class III-fold pyridoxal phosphate-dependent enzyme, partial [Pseudomonadota bacterium]